MDSICTRRRLTSSASAPMEMRSSRLTLSRSRRSLTRGDLAPSSNSVHTRSSIFFCVRSQPPAPAALLKTSLTSGRNCSSSCSPALGEAEAAAAPERQRRLQLHGRGGNEREASGGNGSASSSAERECGGQGRGGCVGMDGGCAWRMVARLAAQSPQQLPWPSPLHPPCQRQLPKPPGERRSRRRHLRV